jgi:hypothetical protein
MKVKRKGYEWAEIALVCGQTVTGLRHAQAHHLGVTDSVIMDEATWYEVIHIPSGTTIAVAKTTDYALAIVEALRTIEGLEAVEPDQLTLDLARASLDLVTAAYGRPIERKEPPKVDDAPWELEPVYRPGFTPPSRVRAADRELGKLLGSGQPYNDALVRAATLALWEEIMATVPGVRKEEAEAVRPYFLLDGTRCTWEGFKVSYQKLMLIGDKLNIHAQMILLLAEDLEAGDWGADHNRRWRAINEVWSKLIIEGWQEWTRAVAHYIASPEDKRAIVVGKHGFVGSRESGWGQLGKKTMYRHPDVLEAIVKRRTVEDLRKR